jgi:sugar lactone lactonase YvrE
MFVSPQWNENGIVVAGGRGSGRQLNQLNDPRGVQVDANGTVFIADWGNDRIVKWKRDATSGHEVIGGSDQLDHPTTLFLDSEGVIICDCWNRRVVRWPPRNGTCVEPILLNTDCSRLTMDDQNFLYVSNWEKDEVKRYRMGESNGTIVAGGNGKGEGVNQLNGPTYVFVDQSHSVYVSDYHNHRVMKWMVDAREGIIVAGGRGQGSGRSQLSEPRGVVVDSSGAVYVADHNNHRVMRWCQGENEGTIIAGGNGTGKGNNQFSYPNSLALDQGGNLYVVDRDNHRVQRFDLQYQS